MWVWNEMGKIVKSANKRSTYLPFEGENGAGCIAKIDTKLNIE